MNKIGKMGRSNKKIPGSRVKSQKRSEQCHKLSTLGSMMEGQEKLKQYSELSTEELKGLKNTILKRYEEYINSDIWKRKQIISQILKECGLGDNFSNRQKVSSLIGNEKQKRERDEISAEDKKELKNTALQHYEEYINSDIWKRKQIILQILAECGLDDNPGNRWWITSSIGYEKQKCESEKEKTLTSVLMSIEGPKHRNRLPRSVSEEINSFIIKNNLHIKYLKAENDFFEKANIAKDILKEFNIYDCGENRRMIQRLIVKKTFKPWSDEEKKVLEKLLHEKIYTAVWNKSGDNKEIIQVRKQIMVKFKEQFPASEHNDNDITHEMTLLVCRLKNIIPKPKDIVQQAAFQVIEKQVRINNISNTIERNISDDLSSQSRGPEAMNNVDKATLDAIRQISNINGLINGFSR